MKESYDEGVANHIGPESCGGGSNAMAEALTGVRAGQVLSREILVFQGADDMGQSESNTGHVANARHARTLRGRRPWGVRRHLAREPGDPVSALGRVVRGPHWEVRGRNPVMNGQRKSDSSIVPGKWPNNVRNRAAEAMVGKGADQGEIA